MQKIFVRKKIGYRKFGVNKILGQKKIWVWNILGQIFLKNAPPPWIKFRQEDIMTEAYRIVIIMSKQFPIFFLHLYCLIAVNILSFQIRPNKTKYQITVSQPINYEQIDNSNYSMPICAHLWLKLARSTMFMWIYRKLTIQSKSVGLGVDFVFSLWQVTTTNPHQNLPEGSLLQNYGEPSKNKTSQIWTSSKHGGGGRQRRSQTFYQKKV